MPIVVACSCGKKYQVADENAGKKMRCKACQGVIAIPAPQTAGDGFDDFGDDFGGGDDFGDQGEEITPKPKATGKKSGGKKAKGKAKAGGKKKSGKGKSEMAPAVKYSLAGGIVVVTAGIILGILYARGVIGGGKKGNGAEGNVATNDPANMEMPGGATPGKNPGGKSQNGGPSPGNVENPASSSAKTKEQMAAAKPAFSLKGEGVSADYAKDKQSIRKYHGKIIEVDGRVARFVKAGMNGSKAVGVVVGLPIPKNTIEALSVTAESRFIAEPWARVGKQQLVRVKGLCEIRTTLGESYLALTDCLYTPLEPNPTIEATADALIQLAAQGAQAVDSKYSFKDLIVTGGRFQSLRKNGQSTAMVLAGSSGGQIVCEMAEGSDPPTNIRTGEAVVFYGAYEGIEASTKAIRFSNCRRVSGKIDLSGPTDGTSTSLGGKQPTTQSSTKRAAIAAADLLKQTPVGSKTLEKKTVRVQGTVAQPWNQGWMYLTGDGRRMVACFFQQPPQPPPSVGQSVVVEGTFFESLPRHVTLGNCRVVSATQTGIAGNLFKARRPWLYGSYTGQELLAKTASGDQALIGKRIRVTATLAAAVTANGVFKLIGSNGRDMTCQLEAEESSRPAAGTEVTVDGIVTAVNQAGVSLTACRFGSVAAKTNQRSSGPATSVP